MEHPSAWDSRPSRSPLSHADPGSCHDNPEEGQGRGVRARQGGTFSTVGWWSPTTAHREGGDPPSPLLTSQCWRRGQPPPRNTPPPSGTPDQHLHDGSSSRPTRPTAITGSIPPQQPCEASWGPPERPPPALPAPQHDSCTPTLCGPHLYVLSPPILYRSPARGQSSYKGTSCPS